MANLWDLLSQKNLIPKKFSAKITYFFYWQLFCKSLPMFKKMNFSLKAIIYPLLMLSAIWSVFLLQNLGLFSNCSGAIIPLNPEGLKGVFFSPFLHGNLEHIIGNSLPIAVLIFLLYQFYPRIANTILGLGWLATGFLVWLLPPIDIFTGEFYYSCIIGASGIIYMLAFFLFFSGIFRWNLKLLAVTLIVGFYYGSLVWGVFPEELFYHLDEPSKISWQSHLSGAVIGVILAFIYRGVGEKRQKYIWEFPNYYSEKDDKLWREYIEKHPQDFQELPQKKEDSVWKYLDEIRKKE